jgi:hypothetical protein
MFEGLNKLAQALLSGEVGINEAPKVVEETATLSEAVHTFTDTGDAYDACQTDDDIADSDILICTDEKVVGLADAWPVAVTKAHGNLHTFRVGSDPTKIHPADKIKAAVAEAKKRGWAIDPQLEKFVTESLEEAWLEEARGPKDYTDYTFYKYGGKNYTLTRRGGDRILQKNDEFGVRPAGTSPGKYRVIIPHLGHTIIYSIEGSQYRELMRNSKPVD